MRKVNLKDIPDQEQKSPKGKVRAPNKDISIGLGRADRQNQRLRRLRNKRYVAISNRSFSEGFSTKPHWLGWKCFLAGKDVGTSRRARAAANAFTVFASRSRNPSIRLGFRARICAVRCLSPGGPLVAPIENGPGIYLWYDRLVGRSAHVLSRPD
jgi:hypothetical protein